MRDYEEKSYYEIQLDNKQLILVFLAAVTVCVLIFVLGVMIGKGQKEAEIAAATRIEKNTAAPEQDATAPQQPLTDLASEANKNKKTTPPPEKQEKPKNAAMPAPVTRPEQQSTEKKPEKFAYEDLDKKDSEKEKPVTPAPAAAPVPDTSAEVPPPDDTPKSTGGTQYTVQIMATSSKPKAEQQLTTLKSKGYRAFLDETKNGNVSVYKVRVGKFNDTQEAKALASRIKKDLRLETWVAVLD